jgi:endonuclease YncB( thermonuclease family)
MVLRVVVSLLICLLSGHTLAHPGAVDNDGCHRERRTGTHHCHPERVQHVQKKPEYDSEHPPKPGDEGVFYGPLVAIVDGDTLKAKVQGVVMKFRLQGVDAPEHDQPYGAKSTSLLSEITRGQNLVFVFSDVDAYGRIIVQAWVGKMNINAEMVRRGAAWFDSEYSQDEELYLIETDARDRRKGLWALPSAERVEPWVWRKAKR